MVIEGAGDEIGPQHIVLHRNNGAPGAISDLHSYYFPLRYPLLFPYREQQWDNLWQANAPGSESIELSQLIHVKVPRGELTILHSATPESWFS